MDSWGNRISCPSPIDTDPSRLTESVGMLAIGHQIKSPKLDPCIRLEPLTFSVDPRTTFS